MQFPKEPKGFLETAKGLAEGESPWVARDSNLRPVHLRSSEAPGARVKDADGP